MNYILRDKERLNNCIEYLKSLPLDGSLIVDIGEYKKSRSNAQNRTYWKWIGIIAKEQGYTSDELHDILKVRFLGTETKDIDGQLIIQPRSTTKLTTKEMGEYMTKVQMLASTLEISLPIPEDYRDTLR